MLPGFIRGMGILGCYITKKIISTEGFKRGKRIQYPILRLLKPEIKI